MIKTLSYLVIALKGSQGIHMGVESLQPLRIGVTNKVLVSMKIQRSDDNRHGTNRWKDLFHALTRLAEKIANLCQLLGKYRVSIVENKLQLLLIGISLILGGIGLNRIVLLLEN